MKTNFFQNNVKLYLSISEKWDGNIQSSYFQRTPSNCLEIVKKNFRDKWQSTKKCIYIQWVVYFQKNINVGEKTTFQFILIP